MRRVQTACLDGWGGSWRTPALFIYLNPIFKYAPSLEVFQHQKRIKTWGRQEKHRPTLQRQCGTRLRNNEASTNWNPLPLSCPLDFGQVLSFHICLCGSYPCVLGCFEETVRDTLLYSIQLTVGLRYFSFPVFNGKPILDEFSLKY